jgi:pyroglutamyl-peptidase
LASNVTTHIFETSAEDVRRWQDDWFDRLSQEAEHGGNETGAGAAATLCGNRRNVVLIHLGVHYKAECFHLESSAYNVASFRVPDERGYQPRDECVLSTEGGCARREEKLSTTLKVPPLVKGMVSRGHPSKLSGDPGRFVCNYTYCYSLDKCRRFNATAPTTSDSSFDACTSSTGANKTDRPTLYSIFVHVPLFQISGKEEQLEFVVGLMDEISMQLATGG